MGRHKGSRSLHPEDTRKKQAQKHQKNIGNLKNLFNEKSN